MIAFYEKADEKILEKCILFIQKNEGSSGQYYVFKECLNLFTQLSKSLLDSHKEFDAAIKAESDKIIELTENIEKEIAIYRFNQAHYCLVLDEKAHKVLEELERIEKNNRTKNKR